MSGQTDGRTELMLQNPYILQNPYVFIGTNWKKKNQSNKSLKVPLKCEKEFNSAEIYSNRISM